MIFTPLTSICTPPPQFALTHLNVHSPTSICTPETKNGLSHVKNLLKTKKNDGYVPELVTGRFRARRTPFYRAAAKLSFETYLTQP